MPRPHIVGIAGNLSRPSRTRALVEATVETIERQVGASGAVYDLLDAGPGLGGALSVDALSTDARRVIDAIVGADVLVVGSPVYKGSYTGLFKHLFDLVDWKALAGVPVVLTATGGSDRHALVIEHQFHPLFSFFGAAIVPTGIYATEKDFDLYRLGAPLGERVERAAREAARLLAAASVPSS